MYEVTIKPTHGKVSILCDRSNVVDVGGIELGEGLWTKVKRVTGYDATYKFTGVVWW